MNLHDVVSNAISSINPFQPITITSRGQYTVNEYGERSVTSGTSRTVMADVQPLSSEDIKFINNYNQSSIYRSFWVSENVSGINRPLAKAGDIVTYNGDTYYVMSLKEDWYNTCGWNHFIGVLQLGGTGDDS